MILNKLLHIKIKNTHCKRYRICTQLSGLCMFMRVLQSYGRAVRCNGGYPRARVPQNAPHDITSASCRALMRAGCEPSRATHRLRFGRALQRQLLKDLPGLLDVLGQVISKQHGVAHLQHGLGVTHPGHLHQLLV